MASIKVPLQIKQKLRLIIIMLIMLITIIIMIIIITIIMIIVSNISPNLLEPIYWIDLQMLLMFVLIKSGDYIKYLIRFRARGAMIFERKTLNDPRKNETWHNLECLK